MPPKVEIKPSSGFCPAYIQAESGWLFWKNGYFGRARRIERDRPREALGEKPTYYEVEQGRTYDQLVHTKPQIIQGDDWDAIAKILVTGLVNVGVTTTEAKDVVEKYKSQVRTSKK